MTSISDIIEAFPRVIPADAIGLPTGGARVTLVEEGTTELGNHLRILGSIDPVDPEATTIDFLVRMPLPEKWNRRMIHYGGGGLDGDLSIMEWGANGAAAMWYDQPTPVDRGFVTFGSDSGHRGVVAAVESGIGAWDSSWALNDEVFHNFAHEALKKTRDAVAWLVERVYGRSPEHVYFQGFSNGGREAFKAIQIYGADYDGVLCGSPVFNWVLKALADNRNADMEIANGGEGWIDAETYRHIEQVILDVNDVADGVEDGLVSNLAAAKANEAKLRERLAEFLTPAQLKVLDTYASPLELSFDADEHVSCAPGYNVYSTCLMRDDFNLFAMNQFSSAPGADDGQMDMFSAAVIRYQVMRDTDFDWLGFDAEEHQEEVKAACRLLNATDPNLDEFFGHGGKFLLYHGTFDNMVTVNGSIQYYELLRERYGDALGNSMRFYLVPGEGHSIGRFDVGADLLGALDAWVTTGEPPRDLVITDRHPGNRLRTRPLCEYPTWPRYISGDPDDATSYEKALPEGPIA